MQYILYKTLTLLYRILSLSLFARAIMSWFVRDINHPIVSFIYNFTEPMLIPMRRLFEKFDLNRGMFDFSFLATFFAIEIIYRILIDLLFIF